MTIPPTEAENAAFRADLLKGAAPDGRIARAVRKLELEAIADAPRKTTEALREWAATTVRQDQQVIPFRWIDRAHPRD